MDGGSTDGSTEVLAAFGDRVTWRSEPDRGQSHAINKAFARSSGEIIGWINSDDAYVDRRAVDLAVEAFRRNPEVGVVYGHGLLVSQQNRVMQFIWAPPHLDNVLHRQTPFIQPSVFLRRSVVGETLVDEDLHYVMDRDLWMRLWKQTQFLRIPVVVGLDRNQPDRKSLMTNMSKEIAAYEEARGLQVHSRREFLRRRATNVALRWTGLPSAIRLPHRLQPAIDLTFPALPERVANQVIVPRARMRQG